MVELTSQSRDVSDEADMVMDMDYYQMLVEKKRLQPRIVHSLEEMRANTLPVATADLFVQFPNREEILAAIRNSPYVVRGKITQLLNEK